MPKNRTVVFAKQSGNLAADPAYGEQLGAHAKELLAFLSQNGGGGIAFVPGGGDGGRGREMQSGGMSAQHADTVGRLMTLKNAIILADALRREGVPHDLLIAPGMKYGDDEGIGNVWPCTPHSIRTRHNLGRVVIIAGGSGQNGYTTDAAVLYHAQQYAKIFGNDQVIALKSMEHDGVYSEDPKVNPGAKRFSRISADVMAANPATRGALDDKSLELLGENAAPVDLRLYAGHEHSLRAAITGNVGTLVLRQPGIIEIATF